MGWAADPGALVVWLRLFCESRYQWTRGGVAMPGATAASYSFTTVDADNGLLSFQVTVTNPVRVCGTLIPHAAAAPATTRTSPLVCTLYLTSTFYVVNGCVFVRSRTTQLGATVSLPATVTVDAAIAAPSFTGPADVTAAFGTSGTLVSGAAGGGLTIQWFRVGAGAIPGASSPTYTLTVGLSDDGAAFFATATNKFGTATSATATLRVSPTVVTGPASASVPVGQVATFSVDAQGPGLVYSWLKNGVALDSSTSTLSYTVLVEDVGQSVAIQCQVTNYAGSVTSAAAALTAITTPWFTAQPQGTVVPVGGTATFSAAAAGGALSLQWYRSSTGAAISGATGTTLTLTAATGAQAV